MPVAAHAHQVRDLLVDIAAGTQPRPSFQEGLQVQRVLEAVERSSADGSRWVPVAFDGDIHAASREPGRQL
jgi:predicted dehydrogenase